MRVESRRQDDDINVLRVGEFIHARGTDCHAPFDGLHLLRLNDDDVVVGVRNDGDEEVEHADDDNDDLANPQSPNDENVQVSIVLIAFVEPIEPVVVARTLKVSDRCSEDLQNNHPGLGYFRIIVVSCVVLRVEIGPIVKGRTGNSEHEAEVCD